MLPASCACVPRTSASPESGRRRRRTPGRPSGGPTHDRTDRRNCPPLHARRQGERLQQHLGRHRDRHTRRDALAHCTLERLVVSGRALALRIAAVPRVPECNVAIVVERFEHASQHRARHAPARRCTVHRAVMPIGVVEVRVVAYLVALQPRGDLEKDRLVGVVVESSGTASRCRFPPRSAPPSPARVKVRAPPACRQPRTPDRTRRTLAPS